MTKITTVLALILSFEATAGTLMCENTKVETLAYHGDDRFMLKLENMNVPVFFCSPKSTWTVSGTQYTTSPETCKMLYSTFLAAKMAQTPMGRVHFDGDDVPDTCDGWSSWKSANIRYFRF